MNNERLTGIRLTGIRLMTNPANIIDAVPFFCFMLAVALTVTGSMFSVREQLAYQNFKEQMSEIKVLAPYSIPGQSQESLDLAAELFSVDISHNVVGPFFDSHLEDRGLTTGGTINAQKTVTIGPAAFTSWSVLGSTLGHEVEIHAKQSFLKVVLLDKLTHVKLALRKGIGRVFPQFKPSVRQLFEEGTWSAEREAYLFELGSAKRFHLSIEETQSILQVMNYYYPSQSGNPMTVESVRLSASGKKE